MKLLLTLTLLFNFAFANIDDDIKTFVKDFRSKRVEAKYYKELQSLKKTDKEKLNKILTRYKQTIKLINPNNISEDKLSKILQRSLNNNVKYIIFFYDSIYSQTPHAYDKALTHEKKVPELKWSKIIEIEKKEGQLADVKAKVANARKDLELRKLDKEIENLDKTIKRNNKTIKRNNATIKKLDEEIEIWNKILGNIQKISK